MKINDNIKVIMKVLVIMLLFYVAVMLIWSYTNQTHKPTNMLWDWHKDGYQPDPLYDRGADR